MQKHLLSGKKGVLSRTGKPRGKRVGLKIQKEQQENLGFPDALHTRKTKGSGKTLHKGR